MSNISGDNDLVRELFTSLPDGIDRIMPDIIERAKSGDKKVLFTIGVQCFNKKLYTNAIAWFQLSAENNYPEAQMKVGSMYHHGLGVSVDYQLAMKWYIKAASLGHAVAFAHIGFLFENGLGVLVNKQKALELYSVDGRFTTGLERLKNEGYSLNNRQKEKSNEDLLDEVTAILTEDNGQIDLSNDIKEWRQIKQKLNEEVQLSKQSTSSIEEELKHTSEKIKFLQKQNKTLEQEQSNMRGLVERLQQLNQELVNSLELERQQQMQSAKSIKQLKKENHEMKARMDTIERFMQKFDLSSSTEAKGEFNDNNDIYYDSE